MALQPFSWGAGGEKASPSRVKKYADIAAALAAKGGAPSNLGEGLNRVGEALLANSYSSKAAAGEQEGATARKAVMDALMGNADPTMADIGGALGNEWVTSDPGSSAIVQALLGQELQQNDPLRQLQIQAAESELSAPLTINGQLVDRKTYDVLGDYRDPDDIDGDAAGSEFFGSTLPYQDAEGNLQYIQLNKGGLPTLPEGARWLEPTSTVNTGTAQTVVGRTTGQVQGAIPIDNAGAASDTAIGKGMGEQAITTIEAGRNALGNNAKLDILESTLSNAPQGAGGALVQAAGSIGIPMEGLDDVQAAQAIINQMVPLQRAPGSGTMSDADLALFKQSLPSIINQPGGNAKIIATLRALNDYTIQHARIEEDVVRKRLTEAEAQQQKAAISNPLANFNEATQQPAGEIDPKYTALTPPEGWGGGKIEPELWQFMSPEDRALW